MRAPLRTAITIDLHDGDSKEDIDLAMQWLGKRGIAATVFIPTLMMEQSLYRDAAREMARAGHEIGSHGHRHDYEEMRALIGGSASDLEFLARSKAILGDVIGKAPTAFRSPCWCHLGRGAVTELAALGYTADSSATPQRLGSLSSTPFDNVWTLAPRRITRLASSLVEVPTSTFIIPAGSPTFLVLRGPASCALVRLLALESRLLPGRALTLQFHVSDFASHSTRPQKKRDPLTFRSFLPQRNGGFAFKRHLGSSDPAARQALTASIFDALGAARFMTLSEIAAEHRGGDKLASTPRTEH